MKLAELFSPEEVNKRSMQAAKELDVAARSAKAKRMLDASAAAKKAKGMLKEFTDFRKELIDENVSIAHTSMPPNILILRRKTVRQFPNNTMVALYFNDKLNQYFSIPYGSAVESVINPINVNEEHLNEVGPQEFFEDHEPGDTVRYRSGHESHLRVGTVKKVEPDHIVVHRGGFNYKVPHENVVHNERTDYRPKTMNEETVLEMRNLSHPSQVKAYYGAQRKYEQWAGDFEDHVNATNPAHTGKIDWDTAQFLHKQGHKPDVAAKKYTDSHPTPFESHFHREELVNEISVATANKAYFERERRGKEAMGKKDYKSATHHFTKSIKTLDLRSKKYDKEDKGGTVRESEELNEGHDPIQSLRNIVAPKDISTPATKETRKKGGLYDPHIHHNDGTKSHLDHVTANALLTVHDALKPEHQQKFAEHLAHSRPKMMKMIDFAWKHVH